MDVINDLTSSLSSDLNSTELAKDLGLGFLAKSTAINGAVNLGIKLLEILFTLFLCWLMIRISSKLVNKFLRTQVQREKLSMSERKAKTLSTVTGSILKYVIYFIGLMSILKQLGVSSESLVVIASAGSVAIGLGAQSIAGDMMEGFFILFDEPLRRRGYRHHSGHYGYGRKRHPAFHKAARFRRRCAYHPEWLYRYGHQ